MSMRMPETCWAVFKWQVINLRSCCISLVDSVETFIDIGISLNFPFPKQFVCLLYCDLSVLPTGCAFFVEFLRRFFMCGFKYLTCLWRSWYWDIYSSVFILNWLNRKTGSAWTSGKKTNYRYAFEVHEFVHHDVIMESSKVMQLYRSVYYS
jgi:hypothetical protein